MPLPLLVLLVALPVWCPAAFWLTRHGMPVWMRDIYVLPAFISSVVWFDVAADELVEALRAFGHILDVPIAILGVTVRPARGRLSAISVFNSKTCLYLSTLKARLYGRADAWWPYLTVLGPGRC